MAIPDITNAVTPYLPSGVEVLVGEEHLAREGKPPRVIWVPTTERFVAPQERVRPDQRALHTREVGFEVHLWGSDFAAAEDLLGAFVYALRKVTGVNYQVQGGSWLGQKHTALGRTYVLGLTVRVPLVEPALGRTTVTSLPQDVAFQH